MAQRCIYKEIFIEVNRCQNLGSDGFLNYFLLGFQLQTHLILYVHR